MLDFVPLLACIFVGVICNPWHCDISAGNVKNIITNTSRWILENEKMRINLINLSDGYLAERFARFLSVIRLFYT